MLGRVGGAGSRDWLAIERCMLALLETPPERREERSRDLAEADLGAGRMRRAIE